MDSIDEDDIDIDELIEQEGEEKEEEEKKEGETKKLSWDEQQLELLLREVGDESNDEGEEEIVE